MAEGSRVRRDIGRLAVLKRGHCGQANQMAKSPLSAYFLRRCKTVVRPYLRKARRLDDLLATAKELTTKQRDLIVQQAIMLLEGFYAHLPLKRAMYAVDPLQRLRLLRYRLPSFNSDRAFHAEMTDIFMSLRDRHTYYSLPAPFTLAAAWLPFKVESYYDGKCRRYLVAHVAPGFRRSTFREGIELLYWNGVPIARAVELAGARSAGNSPEARHALGLQILTARALETDPLPDAEWVTIRYRTLHGRADETRVEWAVTPQPLSPTAAQKRADIFKFLFASDVLKFEGKRRSRLTGLESRLPNIFRARIVRTSYGSFGYIRIFSFFVDDPDELVSEFVRLIKLKIFPQNGLIIDVRDNPGGRTAAAEMLLQLISPLHPIMPERVYFANTPHILKLCQLQKSNRQEGPRGLQPWIDSVKRAMETSAMFSANFPRNDERKCNSMTTQKYPGRVVVITNALTYSAAEFFAAGFQDHGGKILGVDRVTGGGGANMRTHHQLRKYFKKALASPFRALPRNVGLSVAYRRSQRVRAHAGIDVEDFGIKPNCFHCMSPNDILNRNVDLINCAASHLVEEA